MNANFGQTVPVKLVGSPACRRYQRMRASVIEEAERLKLVIQVEEIGDTEALSRFNPLSLPRLYIGDELIASQNPPKAHEVVRALTALNEAGQDE